MLFGSLQFHIFSKLTALWLADQDTISREGQKHENNFCIFIEISAFLYFLLIAVIFCKDIPIELSSPWTQDWKSLAQLDQGF